MSYTFSVNQTPSTGAVAFYTLISTLVTAGWVKQKDSDGTTYSSSGTQVTSGNTGSGGFGNSMAWIVIKAPTVGSNNRSWCFQLSNINNTYWRVKYSANAGFTAGSPSATQTPSASDEEIIIGSGTDASPGFTNFLPTDGGYRWHIVAGGSPEFYNWTGFTMTTGTNNAGKIIFQDSLATGSFSTLDPDPCVVGATYSTVVGEFINNYSIGSNVKPAYGWLGATNNTNNFVAMSLTTFGGISISNAAGYGVSPFSNKDIAMPLYWGRNAAQTTPIGLKGLSSLFKGNSTFRANMDVFNLVGTRDSVYYQSLQIPWDGSIPII